MNPFTQPTVARPALSDGPSLSTACPLACQAATEGGGPSTQKISSSTAAYRKRSVVSGGAARARRHISCWLGALGLALAASGTALAVDVNLATLEQLQSVRGIGPKTAQTILDERGRGGPFDSFEDLSDRVKGIGSKKAAALQASGLTVGATAAMESVGQTAATRTPRPARAQQR